MQEIERLIVSERIGFLTIDDIIRHSSDISSVLGSGNETLERAEAHGARMVERRCGKSISVRASEFTFSIK
jgi:hypothetical protein